MGKFDHFHCFKRIQVMNAQTTSMPQDYLRQGANLLAAPLIWICSSLGFSLEGARSPSEFSDLSENLLVPQPLAFSIWFPIFIGIFIYAGLQALKTNRTRPVYRKSGWWVASGLWGIATWGLATAFLPNDYVELIASLIFIPTMCALVWAMVLVMQQRQNLTRLETLFLLSPISFIAGWCSIAVFVGLNGLVWSMVQPWGWSAVGTAISILSLALWWIIYVLRQGATNKIYAIPIIWGLGFLALRHLEPNGSISIASISIIGIFAVFLACTVKPRAS